MKFRAMSCRANPRVAWFANVTLACIGSSGCSIRRNVAVSVNTLRRQIRARIDQHARERGKGLILSGLERYIVTAFQFDTDRKIVNVFPAQTAGSTGVPGALVNRYKLNHLTVPTN